MELALDIFGPESMMIDSGPASGSWPGALRDRRRDGYPVSAMMSSFFFSRSETIWGGTSQIQRNIVGERVLGLPKEPRPKYPPMSRSATGVAENTATPTRLVTLPFVAVTASMLLFFLYVGMAIVAIPRFVEFELDGGEIGIGDRCSSRV
ncbi:MAG: hypothetical protein VX568_00070, partial [Actinomycetota bacterium]|nr:hypothetical protein [Actinomycetota bacterium]